MICVNLLGSVSYNVKTSSMITGHVYCCIQPVRRDDRVPVNKLSNTAAECSRGVQSSSDIVASQSVIHDVAHGYTAAVPPAGVMHHAVRGNSAAVASAGNAGVELPPERTDFHRPAAASAAAAGDNAASGAVKITFPLGEPFEPLVVCQVCFTDGKSPAAAAHNCQEDTLVVQYKRSGAWFRVRERINHVDFAGRYHMCNQLPDYAIGKRCPRGDHCTFAHSEVERALWMAEKSGQFNIRQFIAQSGSRSQVAARHTVQSVLAKHPGQLAFLCRDCYLYNRRVSMQSPSRMALCSVETHDWLSSAVLAHCSSAVGNITLVSPYPTTATATDFTLCLMGVFCRRRWMGECTHAHSVVERDLWQVQRDCGISQRQIVHQVILTCVPPSLK